MVKKFRCADVGLNCDFETTASTTEDMMTKIADHAKNAHGISELPKGILARAQAAIKET